MTNAERFSKSVITTLAKRAASRCSNPDCGAITNGPAEDQGRAVNVGEAAHIYGANPGSARHDQSMAPADRNHITNAIWLCSTCHKLIDDDPIRYPPGLLFEWQREHEQQIARRLGKTGGLGAELRHRYQKRHLEEFGHISHLAERLIIEKEPLWEYRLTAEALRFELAPIVGRWIALRRNLYAKPLIHVPTREFGNWLSDRAAEASNIVSTIGNLLTEEFHQCWDSSESPNADLRIVTTCRLLVEACSNALAWEEAIRFTTTHRAFQEILPLARGIAGNLIDEAAKIPEFLTATLDSETSGTHTLKLSMLTITDDRLQELISALGTATDRVVEEGNAGSAQH